MIAEITEAILMTTKYWKYNDETVTDVTTVINLLVSHIYKLGEDLLFNNEDYPKYEDGPKNEGYLKNENEHLMEGDL